MIHEYLDPSPGTKYRCHIFFNPGSFVVTDKDTASTLDYLVVGGGGGGGGDNGGGGGAGVLSILDPRLLLIELIQSRLELVVKELGHLLQILLRMMEHLVHLQILGDQQQELPEVEVDQEHVLLEVREMV